MENKTHDPYLNTAQRSLQNRYYREQKIKQQERDSIAKSPKSFLSQNINISDYINLSENSINTIIFSAFLLIPYITGIIFIFLIIAKANIKIFQEIDIDEYFVYWSIGYEILASIMILLIIKSAINFKKCS
jgi:hypothetical protein